MHVVKSCSRDSDAGVRGQNDDAASSEYWPEGLQGIAGSSRNLSLSKMELPGVLMECDDRSGWLALERREQVRGDHVTLETPVAQGLAPISVVLQGSLALKVDRTWIGEFKLLEKGRPKVGLAHSRG